MTTTEVRTPTVRQADFTVDAVLASCGCTFLDCNELLAGRWEGFVSTVSPCAAHQS